MDELEGKPTKELFAVLAGTAQQIMTLVETEDPRDKERFRRMLSGLRDRMEKTIGVIDQWLELYDRGAGEAGGGADPGSLDTMLGL